MRVFVNINGRVHLVDFYRLAGFRQYQLGPRVVTLDLDQLNTKRSGAI